MSIPVSMYARVFDLVPEIVLIIDPHLRIIDCNEAATKAIGLGGQGLRKLEVTELIAEAKRSEFREQLLTADHRSFQTQFVTADQSMIDVEIQSKQLQSKDKVYSLLIGKNITGEKKKELDLLRFSNVIRHTINPIQITDVKGAMVYVNPAFERVSGYSNEELIGRNPSLLSSGKHPREFWSNVWSYILSGKVWHGEVENRRKDGNPFYSDLIISPIIDESGTVVGFLGAHRDITEQKALEEQLVRSQRMESIGTLAAGIAHEVGNPLTSISSLVQVIERTTADQFAKEKLGLIKSQVNRIAGVIHQLVDFSRPSTHVVKSTDVNRVIRDALSIVQYGKKVKDVQFDIHFDEGIPPLRIVADQLQQVFINVFMNAVDALQGKAGRILVVSKVSGDGVHVEVTDTGKGISVDDLEKIFVPFFTTKEIGQGTGLGLWVSYGIIRNFGGDILVESKVGQGTTFTIVLPVKGI